MTIIHKAVKTNTQNLVFIVEDNEMYSTMLDYLLSTSCISRFISFKSGEECIQNLYMNPFMVILDYGLPGMDGIETIKEIKKYNPDTAVVVLTAKDDATVARSFFKAGAYDFLLKEKTAIAKIVRIIDDILNKTNNAFLEKSRGDGARVSGMLFALSLLAIFTLLAFYFLNRQ